MGKIFFRITLFVVFAVPFIIGACNSDDYVIDAKGISADSSTIYLPYQGTVNTLNVSTFKQWWVEKESVSQGEWLTVTPDEGDYSSEIRLTSTENTRRRRSTRILFHNEFMADTVIVIQRAQLYYEPGAILYNQNFGVTATDRIAVNDFTGWSAGGSAAVTSSCTGTDAYVQSTVRSSDYFKEPHEIITGGNSAELAPGGVLNLPRMTKGTNVDSVILTLYVAAYDGGSYRPMQSGTFLIEGSTDMTNYQNIPVDVNTVTGWQRLEPEFKIQPQASNFFIRFRNIGTQSVYIDDVKLESAGTGKLVIGVPTPLITTREATDIKDDSAQLNGIYTLPEDITIDRAGFEWRLRVEEDPESEVWTSVDVADTEPDVEFLYILKGLQAGKQYQFRAFTVHNGNIYTYGAERTFTAAGEDEEEETP